MIIYHKFLYQLFFSCVCPHVSHKNCEVHVFWSSVTWRSNASQLGNSSADDSCETPALFPARGGNSRVSTVSTTMACSLWYRLKSTLPIWDAWKTSVNLRHTSKMFKLCTNTSIAVVKKLHQLVFSRLCVSYVYFNLYKIKQINKEPGSARPTCPLQKS